MRAYSYQGCYIDTLLDFELANIPVIDRSHTTQESCELHCSHSGYSFFALEFGFLCRCGNALPDPARGAQADMCDVVSCISFCAMNEGHHIYYGVSGARPVARSVYGVDRHRT